MQVGLEGYRDVPDGVDDGRVEGGDIPHRHQVEVGIESNAEKAAARQDAQCL